MKLLIATGNHHKFLEISEILNLPNLSFVSLLELSGISQVSEDGDTFEANAIKKAVTLAKFSGMWTLADDSGLEVDALNGAPGVYSARYAGEPTDDAANNRKLLAEMKGVLARQARFRCVMALSDPSGLARTVSGACEGVLLTFRRGCGGFGYDPLFVPNGYDKTFAELPAEVKNLISDRGRALMALIESWRTILCHEHSCWPA